MMSKGVRSEVMWFANQMEKKLRTRMSGQDVWRQDNVKFLAKRLLDEVEELVVELNKATAGTRRGLMPDMPAIIDECVDVANFAMMIADKAKWSEA